MLYDGEFMKHAQGAEEKYRGNERHTVMFIYIQR
jgi:hypothetical protein